MTLDTNTIRRAIVNTETITLFSRATESTFNPPAGTTVENAKRVPVAQSRDEIGGIGLKRYRRVWHVWTEELGGVVPKANDVVQDSTGARWSVQNAFEQRMGTRFRLETVKEI